jgi:hypothetical protein
MLASAAPIAPVSAEAEPPPGVDFSEARSSRNTCKGSSIYIPTPFLSIERPPAVHPVAYNLFYLLSFDSA